MCSMDFPPHRSGYLSRPSRELPGADVLSSNWGYMLSPTVTLLKWRSTSPKQDMFQYMPKRLDTCFNSWVFLGSINKNRVLIKQTYGFKLILASPKKIDKWKAWTYYQLNIIRLCAILSIMVQTLFHDG